MGGHRIQRTRRRHGSTPLPPLTRLSGPDRGKRDRAGDLQSTYRAKETLMLEVIVLAGLIAAAGISGWAVGIEWRNR